MRDGQPAKVIKLSDYKAPAFLIDNIKLSFELHDNYTEVSSTLSVTRNAKRESADLPFELNGEGLQLLALSIDDEELDSACFSYDGHLLSIASVPDDFVLRSIVRIEPHKNTALEGLYVSNGMYCTQCEAEGFRRITFFPDRPDVLARFEVTVNAEKSKYPVLLSNGNPIARGENGARHWVTWQDPFPKPCYLFALVAGDLQVLEDSFVTCSGREVSLQIFCEPHDIGKLDHAMDSLKRSMEWDEQAYGREYDLDIYMIVAVSHFNMGAMENKGLNIFNTSCVLAHPDTTTDLGYQRVEAVVAHEYFHNWSGNRVTCRDWFQLSLKEGFTVFRDQSFSADMHSASVKRIEDVSFLRTVQFAEDGGPMAHAVRPDQYEKIDNFYTVTIYEKGAEVVRMLSNLLGDEQFRRASDLYFERFDGQAVTCDDFVDCMEEISGQDLRQFRLWYSQAGTPLLKVTDHWVDGLYTLTIEQSTPSTPGQLEKQPLMIPLSVAMLGAGGDALALNDAGDTEIVLFLTEERQEFIFDLPEQPVPSLLRGASAPVRLDYNYSVEQLSHILAHDTDGFCRWDAAQRLYRNAITGIIDGESCVQDEVSKLSSVLISVLDRSLEDPAEAALLLTPPSEKALSESYTPMYPEKIHAALTAFCHALGQSIAEKAWQLYESLPVQQVYIADSKNMALRMLKSQLRFWLVNAKHRNMLVHLPELYSSADNMTERLNALSLIVRHQLPEAEKLLADAAARWGDDPLAMDQWFSIQAAIPGERAVGVVEQLLKDERFDWTLPNRVRSVLGVFVSQNLSGFHKKDGSGYALFSGSLKKLDKLNPQIAARLASAAGVLSKLDEERAQLFRNEFDKLSQTSVSDNLQEILDKLLS